MQGFQIGFASCYHLPSAGIELVQDVLKQRKTDVTLSCQKIVDIVLHI